MGFVDGFQWLNGSFTERVEQSRLRRPPRDMDVVTFVRRPPAFKPAEHHRYLFDTDAVRARFLTDSYYVALDTQSQEELVTVCTYWYSMWSHRRRDLLWKGFLQIDLGPGQDTVARERLASLDALGGQS